MKRKFILATLLAISIFSIGCESSITLKNKDIIVIDENTSETIQEKGNLELNLVYKGYSDKNVSDEVDEYDYYHIIDNALFKFRLLPERVTSGSNYFKHKIVNIEMKNLNLSKDEEDLNSGWTTLNIGGDLFQGGMGASRNIRIRTNNKIYKLLSSGELKEIEDYREIYKSIEYLPFYEEVYNGNLDTFPIEDFYNLGIIDEETNRYFEIENTREFEELGESGAKVFEVDGDKIYLYSKIDKDDSESQLIIGYIENNKFYNLFKEENFTIMNPGGINLLNDSIIMKENKLLFFGKINEDTGMWHYDLETKKLSLQIEFEENIKDYAMYISPTNKNLVIVTSKEENKGEEYKLTEYIGSLEENIKIKEVTNTQYNVNSGSFKTFKGFSEDGKNIYYDYYDEDSQKIFFEIYEIKD